MTAQIVLFLATCFLSYSNGANDNFKGVATLLGSMTASYRTAIWWATATTMLGSLCSIFLAGALLKSFSGQGMVPDAVAASPQFLLAVGMGAGFTVMLASLTGFPISTTHSLIGALVGAGMGAAGTSINFTLLGHSFFLPLLLSPLIAVALGATVYTFFRTLRISLGITKEWCFCVGEREMVVPIPQPGSALLLSQTPAVDAVFDTQENCRERYKGRVMGVSYQGLLDVAHFASAGIVSFARGLNDTPKITALLVAAKVAGMHVGMGAVAIGIAAGGLFSARKVARTMGERITELNPGQGFAANIVTGALVLFASRLGLPVSTTHVAVGSLFGMGLITRKANVRVVRDIVLSWVLTLPVAAISSWGACWALASWL